jgi:hypothetical protein
MDGRGVHPGAGQRRPVQRRGRGPVSGRDRQPGSCSPGARSPTLISSSACATSWPAGADSAQRRNPGRAAIRHIDLARELMARPAPCALRAFPPRTAILGHPPCARPCWNADLGGTCATAGRIATPARRTRLDHSGPGGRLHLSALPLLLTPGRPGTLYVPGGRSSFLPPAPHGKHTMEVIRACGDSAWA